MTDVARTNHRLIRSPQEAADTLYTPNPPGLAGKIGVECETHIYETDPATGAITMASAAKLTALQQELRGQGHDAQLEAAGVLEYASPPVPVGQVGALARQVTGDLAAFAAAVQRQGLHRAPFPFLPTATLAEAQDKMGERERLRTGIAALMATAAEDAVRIPLLTAGVQVSLSPGDPEQMFRMARRAYALTPLLIAAMSSTSGYSENNPARQDYHPRGQAYLGYGGAGGIDESFLKARNGAEYVRNHAELVFATPMFFCYGQDGAMIPATPDRPITFAGLAAQELNTQANYELAESFLYHDVKICNLRDAAGSCIGKRIEIRAADTGGHQTLSTLLLTAAVIPDGPTAQAFEQVLQRFGLTLDPPEDAKLLLAARDAAVRHQGRFMDVPFGTGTLRELGDAVAGLLGQHYAGTGLEPQLTSLTHILKTGECDAKVAAESFPSLAEVRSFLADMPALPPVSLAECRAQGLLPQARPGTPSSPTGGPHHG